jgi:hypothetical protein
MHVDSFLYSPFIVPIIAIVGWFAYSIVRAITSARVRELEVRERIAMIERGLVPPPEKDPGGFDRAMRRYDEVRDRADYRRAPGRYRSLGITLIGIGFGLMLMIGVAGDSPEAGIGVGGFLVVIGLAFVVNGMIGARYEPYIPPGQGGVPPAPPSGPTQPS